MKLVSRASGRGWFARLSTVHDSEEVGHNFRGMFILLSRIIDNELFLLTQRVDLGCVGVHYSLWQTRSNYSL